MYNLAELFYKCAYTIQYMQVGDSVNYAFEEVGDTLFIYFQGSNSITDWVENFYIKKKPYKDMEIPYKVHGGFLHAWKQVEDIIIEKITTLGDKYERKFNYDTMLWEYTPQYKYKNIVVVGYSHGGALSFFAHECCWYHRPDIREHIFGYGFEAPRVYASWFVKEELKERWKNYIVVKDNEDIVVHCPPIIFGYRHISTILKVKGDVSLVKNKLPCCVKSHYPQVVLDGLNKYMELQQIKEN